MKTANAVRLGVIIAMVVVGAAGRVDAAGYLWTAPTGTGSYDDGTNWSFPSLEPTSADSVRFLIGYAASADYTVNFNQDEAASFMGEDNAFAESGINTTTFNLNGHTWTTGNGGQAFIAGSPAVTAVVTGGGVWDNSANFLNVGDGGAVGNLTIDSATTVRAFLPEIAFSATGPNPSTLWVKSGGALEVANGSSHGQIGDNLNHTATITGGGTIRPDTASPNPDPQPYIQFNNYGIIAPGDAGPGTLTMQDADVTMQDGSTLAVDISGTGPGQYDQLLMTRVASSEGEVDFFAGSTVEIDFLTTAQAGTYDLVVAPTGQIKVSGSFVMPGVTYTGAYGQGTLQLVALNGSQDALELVVIPEPSMIGLFALTASPLLLRRQSKRA